jgi:hydrogenase maturation protein HypF
MPANAPIRSSSHLSAETADRRVRVRVTGTVQGVGFRPYVYRLAGELGLAGWVLNDAHGVLLEVEGDAGVVDELVARLGPEAPPLAVVEDVTADPIAATGERAFAIRRSPRGEAADAPVTPDTATCADCLRELFDPRDRRYRYPFINCTNCGPRFTIVRGVPYDRPYTTMAAFTMCDACQAEYDDPGDRRFHAQPNACPECGPAARLVGEPGGTAPRRPDAVRAAADALRDGAVVAVKGVGGFHLACRADDERAVAALRARKHREDKPFALMVASIQAAAVLVDLGDEERALLSDPARPIVLAPRHAGAPVAAAVAPGAPELGVMLPYSPLHHLLLSDTDCALVMTSGNASDEPIAYRDEDARERLSGIADVQLINDRPIETRTDDSVVRVVGGRRMFVRRSRGYVPASIRLPHAASRPILACGAELKSTFCVCRGRRAWVGHHIGDLKNYETLRSFADGVAHFERLFAVQPSVVAHDLHPEYLSTKYALEREGVELVGVQHHHAHLAACLAEHGEDGLAVGAIFDGTGYGSDGTVWGGELLAGDLSGFRRVGSLAPIRMPGGERAIAQPWRMACAWLSAVAPGCAVPAGLRPRVEPERWRQVARLADTGLNSPITTSIGRLFDAVAALCGVRAEVNYEGQAAIELEAACEPAERGRYELPVSTDATGFLTLDPRATIEAIAADVEAGAGAGVIASRFHAAVAGATVEACTAAASVLGTEVVVLSGGVFLNRRLVEAVGAGLGAAGLRVLVPERLPPGDGGISYGQAAVAARRLALGLAAGG